MNYEILAATAALITLFITLLALIINIRFELKNKLKYILEDKLFDEKRHSHHELQISLLNEKFTLSDANITGRLDEIKTDIASMNNLIVDHIKERHFVES